MRAVGILVAISATSPEPDEEALGAQATAAGCAEAALEQAGFALVLRTASEVLGVRLLPARLAESTAARAEAVALARSLPGSLSAPSVRILVAVHAADVDVRQASGGPEIAGGPLCQTTLWVPVDGEGFVGTPQAMADL